MGENHNRSTSQPKHKISCEEIRCFTLTAEVVGWVGGFSTRCALISLVNCIMNISLNPHRH